jgi:hypothetical protein
MTLSRDVPMYARHRYGMSCARDMDATQRALLHRQRHVRGHTSTILRAGLAGLVGMDTH